MNRINKIFNSIQSIRGELDVLRNADPSTLEELAVDEDTIKAAEALAREIKSFRFYLLTR